MTDALPFVLPTELEPWRGEIEAECGGCTAEELLNDHETNGFNNALKAALISMCDTKVRLIARLHRQGRLADPAAIRKQERELAKELVDAIEGAWQFYGGGDGERAKYIENAIHDARAALEDSDA